ncbi:MAG: sulfurtransferase TusA family protein [Gammaproteobacteria bacterium]|nr:sulfurtransferase TusA family protein [Gammaproteobacteria bacterium]
MPVAANLDATGLTCPLPLLKTKVELAKIRSGEILHVIATDPMASLDFRAFCLRTQHEMVHWFEADKRSEFYIRKA